MIPIIIEGEGDPIFADERMHWWLMMKSVLSGRDRGCAALLAAATLGLAACGTSPDNPSTEDADDRIRVVTSTNVWGAIVSAIGGDHVRVLPIIDNAVLDPHSYQATAEDAADTRSAQLLASNGGGYDEFFTRLAEQAEGVPNVVAFDTATGMDERENEHIWYDLSTVLGFAEEVTRRLGELAPEQHRVFEDHLDTFTARVEDELNHRIDEIAADAAGTPVVATEPLVGYLLEQAELDDMTPDAFSDAVENETDVPIAAQEQIIARITDNEVAAVVNNTQTGTQAAERVIDSADEARVPVVEVTETLPEGQHDFVVWMNDQITDLAGALDDHE